MLFFGTDIPIMISFAVTAILAFAYHEFAHAVVADRLGDRTPRSFGRITLNPLVHLDPIGTILLLVFGFGWASTPVNPNQMRGNPRTSHAIVALAGPLANLLMAILWALPIRLGLVDFAPPGEVLPSPYVFLIVGVQINLILMAFNMLPIPPLDGFTILLGLLPAELAYRLEPARQYGMIIFLVVFLLLPRIGFNVFGLVIGPVLNTMLPLLTGVNF